MLVRLLVQDDATGRVSASKLWANVAKAAATAVFLKQGLWVHPPPSMEGLAWLTLVYVGTVGGSELAAKAMHLRWGGAANGNGGRG